ncbi:Inner membrane protein YrbG [Planctomycetes bacterium CA13]|uniref:Inner membrane protein YrbG n=1 Tax=Novipirellula herctigrandis TaxID=2527986 RepID=A0A5C5Z5A0_9BACT|nr:Inner membrane protein YrbG [Planctomycetes bacterium CA13]
MGDWIIVAGQITLGLALLVAGGELLVRGAVAIASALRISPLVIGLTVVAFGTSAPELGVSLQASLSGSSDVAVGNVVGSNIVNILLVLGAASMITPLLVSSQLIRLDVPIMIAASFVVWWMGLDGVINRFEGAILFASLLVYLTFCIRKSRKESRAVQREFEQEYGEAAVAEDQLTKKHHLSVDFLLILAGLVLLGLGSRWLVAGATTVATALGVSQLVIGLTVVAIGTSLPEVVTSVVASYRGERDIAVGNVVGSNLFNLLCVLGLTATVSPMGVAVSSAASQFDIPVMVGVAVICMPIFFTDSIISRWEGALFVTYYVAYNTFVVLTAKNPLQPQQMHQWLMWAVLPLVLFPIATSMIFPLLARRKQSK